jgi:[ribosomal protein S5]-alanine N-acetyltransferase
MAMTLLRDTDRIESDRLVLRRIAADDLDYFTRLHADPEVARYIGRGPPRSAEESRAWLQDSLESYRALELGQLAVERKSDGELIGRCGLTDLAVEMHPANVAIPKAWFQRTHAPTGVELKFERELGYSFDRSCWGQGYASEAARRVFEYVRDALGKVRIISIIHPDNVRSLRLAQRFGVQREGSVEVVERTFHVFVWPAD